MKRNLSIKGKKYPILFISDEDVTLGDLINRVGGPDLDYYFVVIICEGQEIKDSAVEVLKGGLITDKFNYKKWAFSLSVVGKEMSLEERVHEVYHSSMLKNMILGRLLGNKMEEKEEEVSKVCQITPLMQGILDAPQSKKVYVFGETKH